MPIKTTADEKKIYFNLHFCKNKGLILQFCEKVTTYDLSRHNLFLSAATKFEIVVCCKFLIVHQGTEAGWEAFRQHRDSELIKFFTFRNPRWWPSQHKKTTTQKK